MTWGASIATLAALGLAACAPSIATQKDRFDYLESYIDQELDQKTHCTQRTVTFTKTTREGFDDYDHYAVEGCGQHTELITQVQQRSMGSSVVTSPHWRVVPSKGAFVEAANEQLRRTATFEMDCQSLAFEILDGSMAPMREVMSSSVGVTGCGKKQLYRVTCVHSGYNGKEHEISCKSMPGSSAPSP